MRKTSSQWSDSVRYIALVIILLIGVVVFWISRGSLSLIIIALLVAYILSPLVRLFTNKLHMKRELAVALAYLIMLMLIPLAFLIIIPIISERVQEFISIDWPEVLAAVEKWIDELAQDSEKFKFTFAGVSLDVSEQLLKLRETVSNFRLDSINITDVLPDISGAFRNMLSFSTNIIGRIVTILILFLTTTMTSVHISKDGHKFKMWFLHLFEERYRAEINELIRRLENIWHNYFAGQIKLMVFIGCVTFLVFLGLGVRFSLILGIIAGFCEVVPNIGPILACVPAMISAAIFGSSYLPVNNFAMVLIVVAASVVIQQAENIFVVPHIMGDALDLPPVVIIIGIMVLSSRLGIFGALLAAPVIGLTREILSYVICKIRREEPYAELIEPDEYD